DLHPVPLHVPGRPRAAAFPQDRRRVRAQGAPGDHRPHSASGLLGLLAAAAVAGLRRRTQARHPTARHSGLEQFPDRARRQQRPGNGLMIASDKIPVFTLAFGVAYAVIYVICTEVNLPLLTYHPATGELGVLWQPPKGGTTMYWYGWMLTSALGALLVAFVAIAIPEPWLQRAIMFGCMAAAAYLIIYTVALFIYD